MEQSNLRWSKKKLSALFTIAICLTATFTFIAATNMGYSAGVNDTYPTAYNQGYKTGVTDALLHVANLLQTKGVTLDWNVNNNGTYTLTVKTLDGDSANLNIALNFVVKHYHNGQLVDTSRGAGTFTNLGKNWTIQQIVYGSAASDTIAGFATGGGTSGIPVGSSTGINATTAALFLGDATTAASSATSTVQATETQLDGMGRLQETALYYSAGTGGGTIGQFNETATKTCTTAGITINEWGLYYRPYSATVSTDANSLIAYDSTPGAKNYAVGDTEAGTWTGTFS